MPGESPTYTVDAERAFRVLYALSQEREETPAMKTRLFASFIVALVSLLVWASGAVAATAASTTGNYIVVLNDDVTDPATLAAEQMSTYDGTVGLVYSAAFKGYSASLPDANVPSLQVEPTVNYVMADRDRAVS